MRNFISIRGAREHNLDNIDLDLERNRLIVITGPSGSGKSSLAFDTIHAEGQRRYLESLSAYARQFLKMPDKPDVDSVEGLSPAISIEQRPPSRNPRSTVGTVTEIHDYLRLLYARTGTAFSPATGLPIESQTVNQMIARILELPEGTRLHILAPVVRLRKGEFRQELANLLRKGFLRVRVDGEIHEIDAVPPLDRKRRHSIEVVVDRIVVREGIGGRLGDSLETALGVSDGVVHADNVDDGSRILFSTRLACPVSGFAIDGMEPALFSFNSPKGACPQCDGLGTLPVFDETLVVPDPGLSLREGAIAPWMTAQGPSPFRMRLLAALVSHLDVSPDVPWKKLPEEARRLILHGSGDTVIPVRHEENGRSWTSRRPFEGVMPNLVRRWQENRRTADIARFRKDLPCEACRGHRLKPEALAVRVNGLHIGEACALSIADCLAWCGAIHDSLSAQKREIATPVLREVHSRLHFLNDVGLGYLSLGRASGTLSGGEGQRIRLASQIGSGLTGVLYVMDEPSIGLHHRDNTRLLATIQRLRDLGNTVIVVEHDEATIRAADHVVDMGPGAGEHGGRIVAQGPPARIMETDGLTGLYLSGRRRIGMPDGRGRPDPEKTIVVEGARGNNLRNISVAFPLGLFVCVTGVSGSGKSTLVLETLYRAAIHRLAATGEQAAAPHDSIRGLEWIDKVIDIDQSPIGQTPRSNPATYTGVFTLVRDWFAMLPESRMRGYRPGRFSFNVSGGRCEACKGDGLVRIGMHFLPDVYVSCEVCGGSRFGDETLAIRYRDRNIADVLAMTVDDAAAFFGEVPEITARLGRLQEVGLGYIRLGQAATTLSGGEAQRVKLSRELSRRATGRTLYILDEPTTGLHFEDIRKLLGILRALTDAGNTVIVIEHNLDVIRTSDWLIDLGPEGGDGGGTVVAQGAPATVARVRASHTGRCIAPFFRGKGTGRRKDARTPDVAVATGGS